MIDKEAKNNKILWGLEDICEYLSGLSDETITRDRLKILIKAGLPGVKIDKSFCAYTDNLDDFMQKVTAGSMSKSVCKEAD